MIEGAICFEVSDGLDGNRRFVGRGCHACVEGGKGGGVLVGYECHPLIRTLEVAPTRSGRGQISRRKMKD